jgi:dienelactone hydrolase
MRANCPLPTIAMSAWGQSRHFDRASLTSGLPRSADIRRVHRHVSKVPTRDSCNRSKAVQAQLQDQACSVLCARAIGHSLGTQITWKSGQNRTAVRSGICLSGDGPYRRSVESSLPSQPQCVSAALGLLFSSGVKATGRGHPFSKD